MSETASAESSQGSRDDAPDKSASGGTEAADGEFDSSAAPETDSSGNEAAESSAEPPADLAESLGSLSLREAIPANWEVVDELAEKHQATVQAVAERALRYATYAPAVAGVIAQGQDPALAVAWPSAQQIKQENFTLRVVSRFLGFFSDNWAARFDGYIERNARERLQRVAQTVQRPLRLVGSFASPRGQFIQEIEAIYRTIVPEVDPEAPDEQPENELAGVVRQLGAEYRSAVSNPAQNRKAGAGYPLIGGLLESAAAFHAAVPNLSDMQRQVKAAMPEIMRGLEQFLLVHGSAVPAPPQVSSPSFARNLAQRFAPRRLERLPQQVEATLEQLYTLLPEDGRAFTDGVYLVCKQINSLARQGADGRAITDSLLKNLLKKQPDNRHTK